MGFFWPDYVEPETGVAGRLGRVLHWAGIIIGLVPVGITLLVGLNGGWDAESVIPVGTFLAAWAAIGALVGRGVRYILAGE